MLYLFYKVINIQLRFSKLKITNFLKLFNSRVNFPSIKVKDTNITYTKTLDFFNISIFKQDMSIANITI